MEHARQTEQRLREPRSYAGDALVEGEGLSVSSVLGRDSFM